MWSDRPGLSSGWHGGLRLRRQLIDEHRQPKCELAIGTQKSLQTDRVILVPGPDHEVETADAYREDPRHATDGFADRGAWRNVRLGLGGLK